MTSAWETFLWTQYPGRKPCLYFVNSPRRVWCRGSLNTSSWCIAGGEICIYHSLRQYFIICHFSMLNARIVYSLVYYKSLQKEALLWTRRRKSLHFALSICLILVVWGPVRAFVFKTDVYQGTDPAGIIITRLSEMSRRARTCVWWETSKVFCLFSLRSREDISSTHGTCQGSPKQNGKIISRKMRVLILTTEWHQTELRYHSR